MYGSCNCCTKENSPAGSSHCSIDELNSRIAVRFFVKKSKRFDLVKQQMQHRLQQLTVKKEPTPECLMYLGLARNGMKARDRGERKEENQLLDFEFRKPRIYECCYCKKIFFHKALYRRHMMRHMRKIYRCNKCNRGFSLKALRRRHELICRC